MKRELGLLFRDSVLYGLADTLNRFAKLLVVPLVAKMFPAAIFGAYDTATVAIYALSSLSVLGLHSSVVIIAMRGSSVASPAVMRGPASTGLRVIAAVSLLLAGLLIVARDAFAVALLGDAQYADALAWAAASIPCSGLLLYALALLQWSFRRAWYVGVALGSALLTILLTYIAAFHTDYGLTGLFVANLVGQAAGALLALWAARDLLIGEWSRTGARDMLKVGLPFAVVGVAGTFMPLVDRFFLVRYHSLAEAGLYGLGQKIAVLSMLVLAGFQAAWGPFAFAQRDRPGKGRLFGRIFLLVCGTAAFVAIMLVLAAPTIARVAATSSYTASAIFVGPLALSYGLNAVFFVVAIGSLLEGRSLHNLTAYLGGLAVMVAINLVLAGIGAAPVAIAWANCAGKVVATATMVVLSQRVHPVPYPFLKGALVVAAAAIAVAMLGSSVQRLAPPVVVMLGLGLTAAFAAWSWFGMLSASERRLLAARIGGRRPSRQGGDS
jgi:O-antigen/teichoic acid export membrane protein